MRRAARWVRGEDSRACRRARTILPATTTIGRLCADAPVAAGAWAIDVADGRGEPAVDVSCGLWRGRLRSWQGQCDGACRATGTP